MSTTLRPILLVESDTGTIELVQKAVGVLAHHHPLVVFSGPDGVRRYLSDAKGRPVAILLNGRREGALSLMSWINSTIDTPVIYFGPNLGLAHLYRIERLTEPLTEEMLRDALNGALVKAS